MHADYKFKNIFVEANKQMHAVVESRNNTSTIYNTRTNATESMSNISTVYRARTTANNEPETRATSSHPVEISATHKMSDARLERLERLLEQQAEMLKQFAKNSISDQTSSPRVLGRSPRSCRELPYPEGD